MPAEVDPSLAPFVQAPYSGVRALATAESGGRQAESLLSSPTENAPREPILTLPGALTALLVVLFAIHFVRMALPVELDEQLLLAFAFIPARYGTSLFAHSFYDGIGPKIWTFLTYALLHADLSHIGVNTLWLLPFGSALARRFGALRFYLFMAATAVAGAGAHLLSHAHEVAPVIGASAAVSGAMAASMRFAFGRGSFLSFRRGDARTAALVPALPLLQALRHPRVLAFLAVWFAINLVFGIGSISIASQSTTVAWQAHIGGFVAGLVLFSLFDPVRPGGHDTPDDPVESAHSI
jgi:membrane associated rhomboid family serine protease